jgi:F0F1-type ATP synthase assembly protein I
VDLRDRRELNNGAGNALNRAVELTVTPMIFGFFGFLLDGRLGTRPLFMLGFFLLVLGYVIWKQYTLYSATMDAEQRKLTASPEGGVDGNHRRVERRDGAGRRHGQAGDRRARGRAAPPASAAAVNISRVRWHRPFCPPGSFRGPPSVFFAATSRVGYSVRLVLLTVVIFASRHQAWVSWIPLAFTLVITHLGLLIWETRHVSASLAFPALKPRAQKGV